MCLIIFDMVVVKRIEHSNYIHNRYAFVFKTSFNILNYISFLRFTHNYKFQIVATDAVIA